MGIKATQAFDAAWNAARADDSAQGSLVSYAEVKKALAPVLTRGAPSRADAQHVLETIAGDTFLTRPAQREVRTFLEEVAKKNPTDRAGIAALQVDFSMRANAPFQMLEVPGRALKNITALPRSIQDAAANMTEPDSKLPWDTSEVRAATLAGEKVAIVHKQGLDGADDSESVEVFSPDGRRLASGANFDPMAGFFWDAK